MVEAGGTRAIMRECVWLEDLPLAALDVSGSSSTLHYIHASHRGEPVAMTDASHTPFGAATEFTATTALDFVCQPSNCRARPVCTGHREGGAHG